MTMPHSDATKIDTAALLAGLRTLVGEGHVLVPSGQHDLDGYQTDWRQRYRGRALAIVCPGDVQEVAQVVRLCASLRVGLVPQGGNTSLVGGAIPNDSGTQIVLSLRRLNRVVSVDATNASMTVQAGCLLADVQLAAEQADLLFPLSLASEGSCTIGGNLASNAGGTQVLRYGTARELCLGLEAVNAQGDIWSELKALRKDNTGYDLRDLLIGSEGTLAVITAATLRLFPRPRGKATALFTCQSMSEAVTMLQWARQELDAGLTAYEVMAALPLQLVQRHQPDKAAVLRSLLNVAAEEAISWPEWTVLIECCTATSNDQAGQALQALLQRGLQHGLVHNAIMAHNQRQAQSMWLMRETIPLAERSEGRMVKHDIGLPTSAMPHFIEQAQQRIQQRWPGSRIVCFGHLGDGNLHYNVQPPATQTRDEALLRFEHAVNELVFDLVTADQGTLSAEHGIGVLRKEELRRRKSPVALAMMRAIKQALDPHGILNPGRVL
jgi:FAD/FMN-containing dehydrogenase